ncbi:MAG: efflux RND transporter periplasmic adaptor subunit [Candidatus Schekmanbacteria bacterium]|nr:efflux RND transporter periplasmic adaptor subunit [Candidatus Schekmanbacteria bacterium]
MGAYRPWSLVKGAISTLAAALVAVACGGAEGGGQAAAGGKAAGAKRTVPAVEAIQARRGSLPLEELVSGYVRARSQVEVRAEVSAPVSEIHARTGEEVQRGQVIVRLRDDVFRDQIAQAEASVRLAEASAAAAGARVAELEATVHRLRPLAADAVVSRMELEVQEAQLAAAVAAVQQAQAQVANASATLRERRSAREKTVIRAPVDGHIGAHNVAVGMITNPTAVLFVLGDLTHLLVEVPLAESALARVRVGQTAHLRASGLGAAAITARLARISPFLSPRSFSTTGEIDVDNADGRLRPGMFVTASIQYGETEPGTLVPTSCLWEDPRSQVRGLFVVEMPASGDATAAAGSPTPPDEISVEPYPVRFQRADIAAEGKSAVSLRGVTPGTWVVTTGQQLLPTRDSGSARVRIATWEGVTALQGLQRESVLLRFLDKQQEVARLHGAAPPSVRDYLQATGSAASDRPAAAAGVDR